MMSANSPSNTAVAQYAFLALPLAFASLPLYIHAPDFYTRDLGLNLGLIGSILLFIRLIDAVQDPIIGYFSDRYAQFRYFIITIGILALSLGMAAVFYGPQGAVSTVWWFGIAMVLATTGYSVVAINLMTIGGLWSKDHYQHARISGWREGFAITGLLLATITPTLLQAGSQIEVAFQQYVWIFLGLIAIGFFFFRRTMQILPQQSEVSTKRRPNNGHFAFFSILLGQEKLFFAVSFLAHFAAAIPGVLVLFFIRDYLDANHFSGLFLFLYFISGAILMGVWVKLAGTIGKQRAWLLSMVLAVATFIWAYFLDVGDTTAYALICVLSGMALGADLALPPAILADKIAKQNEEAEATQYFALLAFLPKVAIAIASGSAFLLLDYLGFAAGMNNPQTALDGLIFVYALVPCLIKLAAALLWWWHIHQKGKIHENSQRNIAHERS